MSAEREAQFKQMIAEFPDSPMGHFSLGKLYLEERRYAEAAQCLEDATRVDAQYAAALVTLGEAYVGLGDPEKARWAFERARTAALAQNHPGLAEELAARLKQL